MDPEFGNIDQVLRFFCIKNMQSFVYVEASA